jgi:hypothetical protein
MHLPRHRERRRTPIIPLQRPQIRTKRPIRRTHLRLTLAILIIQRIDIPIHNLRMFRCGIHPLLIHIRVPLRQQPLLDPGPERRGGDSAGDGVCLGGGARVGGHVGVELVDHGAHALFLRFEDGDDLGVDEVGACAEE